MFSIIIPTLNEEENIAKVICQFNEVKDQYNIEIIVSDSGSIDYTVRIAKKCADTVIAYNGKNCNISKTRNLGAKNANNEFLVFLDADILIDNVELFFDKLITTFNNEKIVAVSPRICVYPDKETKVDKFVHFIILLISRILNKVGIGYSRGGCQIIRTKFFNKVKGYNENFIAAEDVDIFRRLRKMGKTNIISDFKVYESPRRYREFGYISVLYAWFMNWFWTLMFNKSFSTKW